MYKRQVLQLLNEELGYNYIYGPDVERDYHSPLYEDVLLPSLQRINKSPVSYTHLDVYKRQLQSIRRYAWAATQYRLQLGRTQCVFQNKLCGRRLYSASYGDEQVRRT